MIYSLNFMKKLILLGLSLILVSLFSAPKALADCTTVYGGGTSCTNTFTIQKFVQGPNGGNYVNSFSINDPKFSPGQNVNFQIVVTNTGSQNIPSMTVTDTLPQFVSFVSGAGSTFNSSNNTLTFTATNIGAGQSKTYNLTLKITGSSNLSSGVSCLINQATGTDNNGMTNTSSSQFCIQNTVTVTPSPTVAPPSQLKVTPPTGPNDLALISLLPLAGAGFSLIKKTKMNLMKKGGEK